MENYTGQSHKYGGTATKEANICWTLNSFRKLVHLGRALWRHCQAQLAQNFLNKF